MFTIHIDGLQHSKITCWRYRATIIILLHVEIKAKNLVKSLEILAFMQNVSCRGQIRRSAAAQDGQNCFLEIKLRSWLAEAECHVPVPRISIVGTFAIWCTEVENLRWRKNEAKVLPFLNMGVGRLILKAELSRPAPILEFNYRSYHGRRTKDVLGGPKSCGRRKEVTKIEIYVILGFLVSVVGRPKPISRPHFLRNFIHWQCTYALPV